MDSPEEILILMVHFRNFKAVVNLVNINVDVNYQNKERVTPLIAASEIGDFQITKFLLNHGADCNVKGRAIEMNYTHREQIPEHTPLIIAVIYGHKDVVKLLIENGADVNFRDEFGRSALCIAVIQKRKSIVDILIQNGAEFDAADISTAAAAGISTAAFLHPGRDIIKFTKEVKKTTKAQEERHSSNVLTLHHAAFDGDRVRLLELINKGTDMNLKDKSGDSALHIVIGKKYLGCAEQLIKEGADVNIKDKHKRTPLHIAASQGIIKIIPHLMEKGAIVDAEDEDKMTPLHHAVFHSFPLCVKQLLNYGACVNRAFANGKTALHVAVIKSSECIALLREENADIFAVDDMGMSPLEFSIELGLTTFKKIFPEKYNVLSADGTTPLHIAARSFNCECLQLMINDGCDVNVVTNRGDTPLHYACSRVGNAKNTCMELIDSENQQNIDMLIKAGAEINKKNDEGMSPIHVCAQKGLIVPLRELIKYEAKINSPCSVRKQTPLLYAAEVGSLDCVKFLIDQGVGKKVANSENCTALMLAAKNNHFPCVKFLLQNDVPLWIL